MTTAFAAPTVSLDGPLPDARPYSLLRQVEVVDGDSHLLAGGAALWPYPATLARLWAPCETGTFANKDLTDDIGQPKFAPFGSYLPAFCTALDATEEELTARALAAANAVESEAVEREFATGEIQSGNPHLTDSNVTILAAGVAQKPLVALALLERAIAATGQTGVIHADPGLTTMWALDEDTDGEVLQTIANDTVVISGAGYLGVHPESKTAPTATQGWAFATGPIKVYRGSQQVLFAIDRSVNDAIVIVERNYLVTWDVQLQAAVLVDLTA